MSSNEPKQPAGAARSAIEQRLAADQQALAEETGRALWPLSRTAQLLADEQAESGIRNRAEGGSLMNAMNKVRLRPRLASGLIGAVLIGGALLMPISYQRTVGHNVTMELSGARLSGAQLKELASQLKSITGAERVEVRMEGEQLRLRAVGRNSKRAVVEQRTAALVRALKQQAQAQGQPIEASTQIEPRRERVESRVYAAALAALIEIRVDPTGKTDRQVEDEIRDQLSRAGATPKDVQFQRRADGTHLEIEAESGGRTVKVIRQTQDDGSGGSPEVAVKVEELDDTREPGMTDDQLRDKIKRQLEARGMTATVTVTGDRIEIRGEKHLGKP